MLSGDAWLDYQQVKQHAQKNFKGSVLLFGGPDTVHSLTVVPFNLGNRALGVILQNAAPDLRPGESGADAVQRFMQDGQRDDQVVLLFPHPFDAVSGLMNHLMDAMTMFIQRNLQPDETPDEWQLAETARLNADRLQLRRLSRGLLHGLAQQDRDQVRQCIQALRPLCGFTEGSFSQFEARDAAAFGTIEQERREWDAAYRETADLRDSLIDALGLSTRDGAQPDDAEIIAAAARTQGLAEEIAAAREDADRWWAAAEATSGPQRAALFTAHSTALTLVDALTQLDETRAHLTRARQEHPHVD
ncbi:dihydroxy-acid dehydratase, ilvD [Deinococcus grandis]|uniref:Dihydroxy-acid dehydratase, ilvD n=1 Tax=Deinococcus grandis TaxID=57498 RepID=A0A100HNF6_9DEIO|nr:hypothetical protein [Deinococcus grandis]GAQ23953.1 dihydroxy-acid dehydratase, ilvD [Deinococcus grandis]